MTEAVKGYLLRAPKSLLEFLATEAQNTDTSLNQHLVKILTGYVAFRKTEEPEK